MTNRVYIIDTSVLINGWVKHYPRSVFPGVWSHIESLIGGGRAWSCHEVYKELERGGDELSQWARARREVFRRPTAEVLFSMRKVMESFPNFAAQGGSKNSADPFVIAEALSAKAVVVTDEQAAAEIKKTKPPRIPNVCHSLGIECLAPKDFFRETQLRL